MGFLLAVKNPNIAGKKPQKGGKLYFFQYTPPNPSARYIIRWVFSCSGYRHEVLRRVQQSVRRQFIHICLRAPAHGRKHDLKIPKKKKAHRESASAFPDAPLHLVERYYIAMP